jgi:ParB-like chromosome segregation protein Spo0J
MSWREVIKVHPAADMFPLMSPEELKELAADIKQHGLRQPACLLEDDEGQCVLIDGRNRLDALELLGDEERLNVENSIVFEWRNLDNPDAWAFVVSANIHRRHLTVEQKRDVIAKLLKASPEKSNRQIVEMAKVSHPTVAKIRAEGEATGDVEKVTTSIDTKGRKQPAKKKRRTPDDFVADIAAKKAAPAEPEPDIAPKFPRLRLVSSAVQAAPTAAEIFVETTPGLETLILAWEMASAPERQQFLMRIGLCMAPEGDCKLGEAAIADPEAICADTLSRLSREKQVHAIREIMERLKIGIRDFADVCLPGCSVIAMSTL